MPEIIELRSIEDNIVSRLRDAVPGFVEVAAIGDVEGLAEKLGRTPASYVCFEAENYGESTVLGGVMQAGTITWQVYTVADSMRGRKSARLGDKGSYEFSDLTRNALLGYDPILDRVGPGADHPIRLEGRQQYDFEDERKRRFYIMLSRFSHPAYITEIELADLVDFPTVLDPIIPFALE